MNTVEDNFITSSKPNHTLKMRITEEYFKLSQSSLVTDCLTGGSAGSATLQLQPVLSSQHRSVFFVSSTLGWIGEQENWQRNTLISLRQVLSTLWSSQLSDTPDISRVKGFLLQQCQIQILSLIGGKSQIISKFQDGRNGMQLMYFIIRGQ